MANKKYVRVSAEGLGLRLLDNLNDLLGTNPYKLNVSENYDSKLLPYSQIKLIGK